MHGTEWLDELGDRVAEYLAGVELSRPDPDTLSLARGAHGVVVHTSGGSAWLSPSVATGTTMASRLEDRVRHLDIQQYAVNQVTVEVAVEAVLAHLRG
jgi:hypothetical protein